MSDVDSSEQRPFVFICYAHADMDAVRPEMDALEAEGFELWYDDGIAPGSEWSAAIAEHIMGCSVFLYFITERSVASEHCRREVNFALEQKCDMLAVHLEPTEVPPALQLSLSHRQAILKAQLDPAAYRTRLSAALRAGMDGSGSAQDNRRLTLGEFELDIGAQRPSKDGVHRTLDPKDMSVLLHLVEAAPDHVTTEVLMHRSWPGAVVGDNALQQVIARLRKAFGDDARSPKYIETLPRRGYRLMRETTRSESHEQMFSSSAENVQPAMTRPRWPVLGAGVIVLLVVISGLIFSQLSSDSDVGSATAVNVSAETSNPKRIAIFDFQDLSPDGTLGWLGAGLAAELRSQLSANPDYEIVPRSLMRNRTISDLAGHVDVAIDGSLQSDDSETTVHLDAIDLSNQSPLWSRRFVGESKDLLDLQRHLATDMARFFGVTIRDRSWGPSDPAAYPAYLRVIYHGEGSRPEETIAALEDTLSIDPSWSDGWLWLSGTYLRFIPWHQDQDYLAMARAALERNRFLTSDPTNGGWIESNIEAYFEGRLREAEAKMRAGGYEREYADLMLNSGLIEEARTYFERSDRRDPYQSGVLDALAMAEATLGNYAKAVEYSHRCAYLAPPRSYNCYTGQVAGLARIDPMAAQSLVEEFADTQKSLSTGSTSYQLNEAYRHLLQINLAKVTGDSDRAMVLTQAMAQHPLDFVSDWSFVALISVGEHEQARRLMNKEEKRFEVYRFYHSYIRASLPREDRQSDIWLELERRQGYTPEWRLELCEKAALWPPESGITCNPADYALPN